MKINMKMVLIKGGTFQFGNKISATVADFQIGKYPVTQKQWRAVMGNNPSWFKNCDDCPVESVSWLEVQDFLSKLNSLTGKTYRLPTETEWEYAARGGSKSKRYLYAGSNNLDEVGWYAGNSDSKAHPVGKKDPNELGLYDMSGNVWEWCEDLKGKDYCVVRGGFWLGDAEFCCVSESYSTLLINKASDIGFRLAI